jgi:hypothetical protein
VNPISRVHLFRNKFVAKKMDCRVKPGNDDLLHGSARVEMLLMFAVTVVVASGLGYLTSLLL